MPKTKEESTFSLSQVNEFDATKYQRRSGNIVVTAVQHTRDESSAQKIVDMLARNGSRVFVSSCERNQWGARGRTLLVSEKAPGKVRMAMHIGDYAVVLEDGSFHVVESDLFDAIFSLENPDASAECDPIPASKFDYRYRTGKVQAVQFLGDLDSIMNLHEFLDAVGPEGCAGLQVVSRGGEHSVVFIDPDDRETTMLPGDFLVFADDELRVAKKNYFDKVYEKA